MSRHYCTSCGIIIMRSAYSDPYLCRECEKLVEDSLAVERFAHLDSMI